jgi:hypothetical protein
MTKIDLSGFSWTKEQVTALSELLRDDFLAAPDVASLMQVVENITVNKEFGYLGQGGLIGKAGAGCGMAAQDFSVNSRVLNWAPKQWKVYFELCYTQLQGAFTAYSLKTGTAISDFTNSDYMNVLEGIILDAMKDFIIRLAWFNDTAASNVTDGGVITDGTDVSYFNILDGAWKQYKAYAAAHTAQLVAITANTATTDAAQHIATTDIQGILQKLVYGAPMTVRGNSKAKILCTQRFWDSYAQSLQTHELETLLSIKMDGRKTLTYNGVELMPVPKWDEMIAAYENTGTKLNAPNRALYCDPNIMGFGVDGMGSFSDFDIWFDKNTELVKMRCAGMSDVELAVPQSFMLAI